MLLAREVGMRVTRVPEGTQSRARNSSRSDSTVLNVTMSAPTVQSLTRSRHHLVSQSKSCISRGVSQPGME